MRRRFDFWYALAATIYCGGVIGGESVGEIQLRRVLRHDRPQRLVGGRDRLVGLGPDLGAGRRENWQRQREMARGCLRLKVRQPRGLPRRRRSGAETTHISFALTRFETIRIADVTRSLSFRHRTFAIPLL